MAVGEMAVECLCGGTDFRRAFLYEAPPDGETRFDFGAKPYRREVRRCQSCGHYVSVHEMPLGSLYENAYVNSTYRDLEGIRRSFERVLSLDASKSDNSGRVRAVSEFASSRGISGKTVSVLDVGSGLCVFLYKMKESGPWDCTALDPDVRSIEHARSLGIRAIQADFMEDRDFGRYDLVTFNKVLEHVKDPIAMLKKAVRCLNPGGWVYVEVPDGEAAAADKPGRQEFFIEHWHVFSPRSTEILAKRAGFHVAKLERLREPSNKYTIRAFCVPDEGVSPEVS